MKKLKLFYWNLRMKYCLALMSYPDGVFYLREYYKILNIIESLESKLETNKVETI